MNGFLLSDMADADLASIWDYIAQDNLSAADRQISKFYEVFEQIGAFPGMGRRREEISSGLRSFPVEKYVIFYRVVDETVRILRVIHGARKLENIFFSSPDE